MNFLVSEILLLQPEIFRNVDLDKLKSQFDQIEMVKIQSGQTILSPSITNQHIYILQKGELVICLQERMNHPIARIQPGDCVGEISIIDDRRPSAYVKATQDSRLIAIHRDVLTKMFELEPLLAVNLLKMFAGKFRQNNNALVDSMQLQQEFQDKAERDALTGLYNRGWMDEVFPQQMDLSERIGQKVTMVMVDVDHFKKINDENGHLVGDRALKHLAFVIKEHLRETDLLVRYGGEEMIVLMPGVILSGAYVVAERVRELVKARPLILENGQQLVMTISLGMTERRAGEKLDSLIERCDRALYEAKANGRNQTKVIS